MACPQSCQKARGLEKGREPGDEAGEEVEAGLRLLGLHKESGFYSRWDVTPWGFAVASVWRVDWRVESSPDQR